MPLIVSILASVVIVGLTYYVLRHLQQLWKYRHIPGVSQLLPNVPLPFPIPYLAPYNHLGNQREMLMLHHRFKQYPVFRLTSGWTTFIVCNSREATKRVMIQNSLNYPKPSEMYGPLILYGDNIVSVSGGEIHKKHRKIVEPAFQERNLRELAKISNESTDMLLKRMEESGQHMLEVNVDMTDVTMDIIGKSNFGVDLNIFHESGDPEAKHKLFDRKRYTMSFYDALDVTNTLGVAVFHFVPSILHRFSKFRHAMDAAAQVYKYMTDLIDERRSTGDYEGRSDLVSLLLEANSNENETLNKLTNQELLSDAFIFLLAGHETSATNLGHLFCELAKHQDIQDRCIEEIDRVMPYGTDFTYDDFEKFTYINNCIKETLRLHSPVLMLPKVAKARDELGGYRISKGTYVWVDLYITHMDDRNWKNPTEFNPDRFNEKYESSTYLPFSFGSRKCVGFQFSLVETLAIVVRILQRYRLEYEPHIDPKTHVPEEVTMVTSKVKKQNLVMKKRINV